MSGIIEGLNTPQDWERCTPDTFSFHVLKKSAAKMLLKAVKPPDHWFDSIIGNSRVDYKIYLEYLQYEKQDHRREILEPAIAYLIALDLDTNYIEIKEWFRYRMFQEYEKGNYTFDSRYCIPEYWADNQRRYIPTREENKRFFHMKRVL